MGYRKLMPRLTMVCLLSAITTMVTDYAVGQTPILQWTFDEESGNALDSGTGASAEGVLQSTAGRTTSTPGGASAFALDMTEPGLDSWVNGGDAEKVDTLTQFTFTTWILLKGLNAEEGGSGNVRLLAKQGPGAFDGFSWNLNTPNNGERSPDNFRMGMFVGGEQSFGAAFSNDDLGADDEWTFVAVTVDTDMDEENVFFYVGKEGTAVEQLGDPITMTSGPVNSTSGIATVNVGYTDAAPGVDFSLVGYQDDVRIYDQVLTLEQLDQVRLANLNAGIAGDFDKNGTLDAADVDLLTAAIRNGGGDVQFDVSQDGQVDSADLSVWVEELKHTYFGDANLDGEFNTTDLVVVFAAGEFEDAVAGNSTWGEGDWDGDGDFSTTDIVKAFQGGGFELGQRPAVSAVPEPTWSSLCVIWMLAALSWSRRR
ncbi:MAG: hypothetical protein KDA92_08950 [Planctomycetales bacterium]|nr:hypothetical protein [Planctomycetales bacterium]